MLCYDKFEILFMKKTCLKFFYFYYLEWYNNRTKKLISQLIDIAIEYSFILIIILSTKSPFEFVFKCYEFTIKKKHYRWNFLDPVLAKPES